MLIEYNEANRNSSHKEVKNNKKNNKTNLWSTSIILGAGMEAFISNIFSGYIYWPGFLSEDNKSVWISILMWKR